MACSDALLRALQEVYKSLVGIDAESVDATVSACLDATKRSVCVRVCVSLLVRAHAVVSALTHARWVHVRTRSSNKAAQDVLSSDDGRKCVRPLLCLAPCCSSVCCARRC